MTLNLIAISLYGNDPKYRLGVLRNLEIASDLLPDWKTYVFCGEEIPLVLIEEIRDRGGIPLRQTSEWHSSGLFWRYSAIHFPFSFLIFRDADSRLSMRESVAIAEWQASGKTLHIMRDHPLHNTPILGGMWGCTQRIHEYEINWSAMHTFPTSYGADQEFLAQYVWPKLKKDLLVHDSFFFFEFKNRRSFQEGAPGEFIGQVYDESDSTDLNLNHQPLLLREGFFNLWNRIKLSILMHDRYRWNSILVSLLFFLRFTQRKRQDEKF